MSLLSLANILQRRSLSASGVCKLREIVTFTGLHKLRRSPTVSLAAESVAQCKNTLKNHLVPVHPMKTQVEQRYR